MDFLYIKDEKCPLLNTLRRDIIESQAYISDIVDLSQVKKDKFNLISSGCGTGKSYFVANTLLESFPDVEANEVLFITSRKITQEQQLNEYGDGLSRFYVYDGETVKQLNGELATDLFYDLSDIFIMTYDKLIYALKYCNSVNYETLDKIKIVIFDECHTLFSDKFIDDIESIKIWIRTSIYMKVKLFIGLTATPAIVHSAKNYWGVGINALVKDTNIRYKADKLTLTSFKVLPYLFNRSIIKGKSIILCYSVKDCFDLQSKINNSTVLVSIHNESFTPQMHLIYKHIIDYSTLPETFIDDNGNTIPLEVLIATTAIREGINLNPECGVDNVISCIPDDLHITQFMGRCRFNISNLIVTTERTKYYHDVDEYLVKNRKAFYKYVGDEIDVEWLESIEKLLRNKKSIERIAIDFESFNRYLDDYWINKKIISTHEREEIRDVAAGAGIIEGQQSKITFNKVMNYIQTIGYSVESGRQTINGIKYTYKVIKKTRN